MASSNNTAERTDMTAALLRPLLVSIPQVMTMLCVSRTTLYELMWQGALTPIRIGRSVRFPIEQLEQFVRDRIAESG